MFPRTPAAVAVAVLGLALAAPAGAAEPHAAFTRVAIGSDAAFPNVTRTAQGHAFVILQAWDQADARALKAANPALKVLVYKDLSFVACGGSFTTARFVPQGVRCEEVDANHREWFLTDSSGNRLNTPSYPWLWLMDVGNVAYQNQWADNVIAEARAEGWDGVFMDDVNPTLKYALDPSRVARYPTDASWRGATRSMLANVGPRIQNAGLLAIPNLCCAREYPGVWADWLGFVSGAMDEMFMKWGTDPATGYVWNWGPDGWLAQLAEIQEAEARGKYFLGVSHSQATDAAAATYGLATVMLASQGRSTFTLAQDYSGETWFPEYDIARGLGAALGDHFAYAGAYRRDFERGMVLVNPSRSSLTVPLGGTYLLPNGSSVSSVSLGPTSAAILRATAAPATPPGAAPLPEPEPTAPPAAEEPAPYAGPPGLAGRVTLGAKRKRPPNGRASASASGTPAHWRLQGWVRLGPDDRWRVRRAANGHRCAVTIFARGERGWVPVGRACTQARGYFSALLRLGPRHRTVRLHAVARYGPVLARSPIITISVGR